MQNYKTLNIDLRRILYHMLFWSCFLIGYSFINLVSRYSVQWDYFGLNILDYLHTLFPLLLCNYVIIYILIPKLIIKKRSYFTFLIITIICIGLVDISDILIRGYYYLPKYQPEFTKTYLSDAISYNYFVINFYNKTSIIIIFFALKFFKDYIIGYYENESLKQKSSEQKLLLLKRQIQPTLLFNALKYIKRLNESNQEEAAAESVALVSDILRYSLYKNQSLVLFKEELSILYKFLKLQKIKDTSFAIELLILKEVDDFMIQHLILFNLIVNVITTISDQSNKKEIILTFDFKNKYLVLGICTNYDEHLKDILFKSIKTLLDSFTYDGNYKLKLLPDYENIKFEVLLKNQ